MIKETLAKLGLNETQIEVYLMLLQTGTSPASSIGKRLKIPRSTARYTCQQLANKGIVIASNKNNSLFFTPKDPSSLMSLLEKEQEALQEKEGKLNTIVDELKRMYNPEAKMPKVTYYEGADGVIELFGDVLKENKTIYGALNFPEDIDAKIWEFIQNKYTPKRKELQNKVYGIGNDNKATIKYRENDKLLNRITIVVPQKDFPFSECLHIYGDKVGFYSMKKNDSYGFVVQDEKFHKIQLNLFKLAWNFARTLDSNEFAKDISLPC